MRYLYCRFLYWRLKRHLLKACDAFEAAGWYQRHGLAYEYLREWRAYIHHHKRYNELHERYRVVWVSLGRPRMVRETEK